MDLLDKIDLFTFDGEYKSETPEPVVEMGNEEDEDEDEEERKRKEEKDTEDGLV